jgi:hypothetical protein
MNAKMLALLLIVLTLTLLAGCTPGSGNYDKDSPAGLLAGIWHGWIAPVSLILGIFDKNIRIYEPNNVGWMYDLGYYVAIIGGFGGISLTRNKLKRKAVHQVYVENRSS